MTTIFVSTPGHENVMHWCARRLNPRAANEIIKNNPQGLSDEKAVDTALKVGDYVSVLKAVWGERDREKRLNWLREHKFHPVLPYERAMAEFKANPTKEGVITAKALFSLGCLRNSMDAACSPDRSIEGPCSEMALTYFTALQNLIEKEMGALPEFSEDDQSAFNASVQALAQEVKEELQSEHSRLPNPSWLQHYGMGGFNSFLGKAPHEMKPEAEWNALRLAVVQDAIDLATRGS